MNTCRILAALFPTMLVGCRAWMYESAVEQLGWPLVDSTAPQPDIDWDTAFARYPGPTGVPISVHPGAAGAWMAGREARELLAAGHTFKDVSRRLTRHGEVVLMLDRHSLLVAYYGETLPLDGRRVWIVRM